MRKPLFCLGLFLAALPSFAQVTVEVALDQDQYLPGETIMAAVRITNRSGQTLQLGADPDWLNLSIEGRDGLILPQTGDLPVVGEFSLETSKVATKRVNLAPYFPLGVPGHYDITASVKIRRWGAEPVSRSKGFEVMEGSKLWVQDFGVPKSAGDTNPVPEVRKYMLQQANYIRGNLRLYLRVTDGTGGKTFRVIPIGPMLSFSRPEAQVDQESNCHVLYQNGPHNFSYTVYNPDGNLVARRSYEYADARPRLKVDHEAKISVAGGVRRVALNDVPPPTPEELKPAEEPKPEPAPAPAKGKNKSKAPESASR